MAAKPSKSSVKKSGTKTKSQGAKRPSKSGARGSTGRTADRKKASAAAVAEPPRAPRAPVPANKPRSMTGRSLAGRSVANLDDEDVLMAHGGGGGGFGRCGGRLLSSRTEQQLCNSLGIAGVVHSHSPRHYEIRYEDGKVAAYAPMIVLRGRGREGKGVVIEAVEDPKAPILRKIIAFRAQYGQEFYVILVASDDVLDEVELAAFDESCSSINVNTLIARLAE